MSPLRALGFAPLVVLAACAPTTPESRTTLTSGEPEYVTTAERVRLSLAAARCEHRDSSCGTYANRDACIAEERRALSAHLDLHYCARGIEQRDVDDCIAAIQSTSCSTAVRDIHLCQTDDICRRWPEEPRP